MEEDDIAEPGSRVTYAVGQLVLWSADPGLIGADGRDALRSRAFRRLAMANPDLAPYGAAARDALIALGLYETLRERIVLGENVGQAYALVATGNAELGFVARASLVAARDRIDGSAWPVPGALHPAIRQDAVLVRHRAQTPARQDAAQAFLGFLLQPDSQAAITAFGYAAPEGE